MGLVKLISKANTEFGDSLVDAIEENTYRQNSLLVVFSIIVVHKH
jgi:hypothetical protein